MVKGIDETINDLLACVRDGLEESGGEVCVASTTVGNPVIAPCCENGDCSGELWANLVRVYQYGNGPGYPDQFPAKPCMPAKWAAEFQISLARCFPTIDERGELPDPTEREASALDLHSDVAAIQRAIHCCDVTEPAHLMSIGVESDPEGGCSYLVAIVQVPVSLRAKHNTRA